MGSAGSTGPTGETGATGETGPGITYAGTTGAIMFYGGAGVGITGSENLRYSTTTGLSMTNLASVASATPSGFYRMLYNPTTGQIVYGSDLSP
jgi:hypothetical protein